MQPDTVIPDLSNPQSWNRYSYVTNRPVNFSDPTGHDYDCGVLLCPEDMRDDSDEGGSGDGRGDSDTDTNGNGVPDVADPDSVIPQSGGPCQYDNLVECLYSGGAWPSGNYTISDDEWDQFTLALYYDVYRRSRRGDGFWTLVYDPTGRSKMAGSLFVPFHTEAYYHREVYDTPFWDHYGAYSGNVCFESGKCYARNDVNYVAQGMWSGAATEGDLGTTVVANVWKWNEYGHLASQGVNYWAGRGAALWNTYIHLVGEP